MTHAPIRRPSAWLPMTMSLAALGVLLVHLARYGVTHDTDEGTSAHLFQILMFGQGPIVAWFAIRWLPAAAAAGLRVLALQVAAAVPPFALLYWFEHVAR